MLSEWERAERDVPPGAFALAALTVLPTLWFLMCALVFLPRGMVSQLVALRSA